MKTRIVLTVLALLVLLANGAYAEPQMRLLSAIDLTGDENFTEVKIRLEGNAYQALGHLTTQKYVIDAVLENTELKDGKPISVRPRGSKLINSISATPAGNSKVKLRLHFKEIIKNINEGLKIEQGSSEITLRLDQAVIMAAVADRKAGRPTAAEKKAAEEKKNNTAPVTTQENSKSDAENVNSKEEVGSSPDRDGGNVAAQEMAVAKQSDGDSSDESEKVDDVKCILDGLNKNAENGGDSISFDEKKDKTLLNLFGFTTAGNDPQLTEVPDGDSEADEEEAVMAGVGKNLPDLTSLYWMAGAVFLLAAIWFLYRRFSLSGKLLPNLNLDKPMKVLSTQKIDDSQNLMMVEIEGRRFLISSNGSDTRLLAQLDDQQDENSDLSKLVPDMSRSVPVIKPESRIKQKTSLKPDSSTDNRRRAQDGARPSFFGGNKSASGAETAKSGKTVPDADVHAGQSIPGMAQRLKNLRKRLD